MKRADPQILDHLAVNPRAQLPLLHCWKGAPRLPELALRQFLSQEELKALFHLASSFVGEGHRQQLSWINTVLTD
jgi:hypothetical protein